MERPNPLTTNLLVGFCVAVAFGIALPHFVSDFVTYQLTLAMAWAVAMLGLNILTGYNGQFSIGHSAFSLPEPIPLLFLLNTLVGVRMKPSLPLLLFHLYLVFCLASRRSGSKDYI